MKKIKQSSYEILGVSANATAREVKQKYKKLIRQYTPEHEPEKFMEVREAYEYFTEEGSDKKKDFPIYKNPFLSINKEAGAKSSKSVLDIQVLATIFETPFDLEKPLQEELGKSAKVLGFAQENQ